MSAYYAHQVEYLPFISKLFPFKKLFFNDHRDGTANYDSGEEGKHDSQNTETLHVCNNDREESEQEQIPECSNGRWNEIPEDILSLITRRLTLFEAIRLRCVCKSWKSLLQRKEILCRPQLPWLVLPHDQDSKIFKCHSLSDGTEYVINLPDSFQEGCWCVGSSKGWLVIAQDKHSLLSQIFVMTPKTELFLFNPVSGDLLPLPSVSSLPVFHKFVRKHLQDTYNNTRYDFFQKVELSSSDPSECIVAAIFFQGRELAFCRAGDKNWSIFDLDEAYPEEKVGRQPEEKLNFVDIVFSKGTLYALTKIKHQGAVGCNFKLGKRVVGLRVIPELSPLGDGESYLAIAKKGDKVIKNFGCLKTFLVKAANGELLLIHQFVDFYFTDEPEAELAPFRESRFCSVKIDSLTGEYSSAQESIGDQVVFVNDAGSLALAASEFAEVGVEPDNIYYAEDQKLAEDLRIKVDGLNRVRFIGYYPSLRLLFPNRVVWFTPLF